MSITQELASLIREKGISITAISDGTGVPYDRLWRSLGATQNRELRAGEFIQVCGFIGKNPMDFYPATRQPPASTN